MFTSISSSSSSSSSLFRFNHTTKPVFHSNPSFFKLRASIDKPKPGNPQSPITIIHSLKHCIKATIIITAAAVAVFKPIHFPARAEPPIAVAEQAQDPDLVPEYSLSDFLCSNPEAIEATKKLLQEKLEAGEDDKAAKILRRLAEAQPAETHWRFLLARVLAENGDIKSARQVFDEILERNPLSYEALFENAVLMDRSGDGAAAIRRLEAALTTAEEESKAKEARDVRFVIAQIRFLQKDVDEAMRIYDKLSEEDPGDYRAYFCRGMIYSLSDRNVEAREQFRKYKELAPKEFEVEGFLQTPLSRMKLFGTGDKN